MDISAEPQVLPTRMAMTIGAITAALMLLVSATGLQILGWIAFTGGIYYGMKRFRKETGGYISYFKALLTGAQTAFFASIILAFVSYVSATMEPSLIETSLNSIEQQLAAFGIPSELAEIAVQQWREILTPVVVAAISIFTYTAIGCMVALVCALFVSKEQSRKSLNL